MHIPRAAIFDLDGLLVNTDDLMYEAVKEYALEQHNIEISRGDFGSFYGLPQRDMLEFIAQKCEANLDLDQLWDEIRTRTHFDQIALKNGIIELLDFFSERLVPLALATNSLMDSFQRKVIHLPLALEDYFEVVITADEVEHTKPAPDIYLMALEALATPAHDTMVLEDSPFGLKAGLAAGCPVSFIPNSYVSDAARLAAEYQVPLYQSATELYNKLNPADE